MKIDEVYNLAIHKVEDQSTTSLIQAFQNDNAKSQKKTTKIVVKKETRC